MRLDGRVYLLLAMSEVEPGESNLHGFVNSLASYAVGNPSKTTTPILTSFHSSIDTAITGADFETSHICATEAWRTNIWLMVLPDCNSTPHMIHLLTVQSVKLVYCDESKCLRAN